MTAPEFDPKLVEQAARAIAVVHTQNPDDTPFIRSRKAALAVLTAVAPTLRAEGWARAHQCDYIRSEDCDTYHPNPYHAARIEKEGK